TFNHNYNQLKSQHLPQEVREVRNDTNEEIFVATDDNTRDGSESETKTKANVVLKTTGSTKQVVKTDDKITTKCVKLFFCKLLGCGKLFKTKDTFDLHLKTHSSEAINGSNNSSVDTSCQISLPLTETSNSGTKSLNPEVTANKTTLSSTSPPVVSQKGSNKRKRLLVAIEPQKRFKYDVNDSGEQFTYEVELDNPLGIHNSTNIHCLDTNCEFVTENEIQLTEHVADKHSITILECNYESCGRLLPSEELFTEHVKLFHKKTNVTKRDAKSTTKRDANRATEPSLFDNKTSLKDHMVSYHSMVPFECEYNSCDQMFAFEEYLREHVSERHTKRFECTDCQKVFRSGFELECHRSLHTGRKRLKCGVKGCDYKCNYKDQLEAHMNNHSGLKPFKCTIEGCGKQFPRRHGLQKHIRFVHSLVRNYVCDHENCNKAFKSSSALKLHQKTHCNDGQVYKCQEPGCGQEFGSLSGLYAHKYRRHTNRLFKCEWPGCDYSNQFKSNYENHMTVHTTDTPFPCLSCDKRFKTQARLRDHTLLHQKPRYRCDWKGCTFKTHINAVLNRHMKKHKNNKNYKYKPIKYK
ncbi:unnamed protein product, partial [Oppiella nova]